MWEWAAALGFLALLYVCSAKKSGKYPPQNSMFFFGDLFEVRRNMSSLPSWVVAWQEKVDHKSLEFALPSLPYIGGFRTIIAVFTPENVEHILKNNFANYVKGPLTRDIGKCFFGKGIFVQDGEEWKLKRKMASNMFSRNLLRASTDVAFEKAFQLVQCIGRKADTGQAFDLQQMFFAFTMDTFAKIAFGVDLHTMERDGIHPFASAFDTVQTLIEKRWVNPLWKLTELISSSGRTIRQQTKVMNDFANKIINAKRRDFVVNSASKTKQLGADLITRFIKKCKSEGRPTPTNEEMRDVVMNFIIAGRDTTACALSWQHLTLLQNPEIYDNVVEEVMSTFGSPEALERLSQNDRFKKFSKELPYIQAVTRETLRLYPSVPKMIKFAVNDDTLPDGTQVPKGAAVLWSQYAMARSSKIWPDRAKVFDPTRWLSKGDESKGTWAILPDNTPSSRYPTFHMMPRLCLGKPLALLEIHMVTAILAKHFNFRPAPGVPLSDEYLGTVVMPIKHGLRVIAKRR